MKNLYEASLPWHYLTLLKKLSGSFLFVFYVITVNCGWNSRILVCHRGSIMI